MAVTTTKTKITFESVPLYFKYQGEQNSNITIKGTIERTAKNKIKISATGISEYYMHATLTFHFAYGTKYKKFDVDYPNDIQNGYKELTGSGIEVTFSSDYGNIVEPILTDKVYTVPEDELYFIAWFHIGQYTHVNLGQIVYNVVAGANIGTSVHSLAPAYTAPSNYKLTITSSTTSSITATHTWTSGSDSMTTKTITIGSTSKTVAKGKSATFENLKPNTNYTIKGKVTDGKTTLTDSATRWTYPKIESLTLTLPDNYKHDRINAVGKAEVSSSYDRFSFKIDSKSYSSYAKSASKLYTDLTGHTSHTIYVKMKNTESGYESAAVSESITTWYDPIYSLSVLLKNKWFWHLIIEPSISVQSGLTISKYEYSIGGEAYQNKGTATSYQKGTTTPGNSNNLKYNTKYTCKIRATDYYGRTKEATATFTTLDERPLYVNGQLREVKVIKPNGSIHYITPNLLSVIKPNGTTVNMNKIINNDSRLEYK